jgi:ADP-ribose pyrophosphatase
MPPPEHGEFRFIGERSRFEGHFFRLVTATVVDPEGYTFERELVRHPGAVCVVALEGDPPQVLLVRQYRAAVDRPLLEVPAGKLDVPGEPLEVAARRELTEEVGRVAGRFTHLGQFLNSPGFSDETTTCFLAEDLSMVARDLQGIEEEHMTVEPVAMSKVWSCITSGEISDAKTIIALALAERLLAERPPS